jgi:hypothetical protein
MGQEEICGFSEVILIGRTKRGGLLDRLMCDLFLKISRVVRELTRGMNHGEDDNLPFLERVNHAIVSDQDLPNVRSIPFVNLSSRPRKSSQPFDRLLDAVDHALSIDSRVFGDEGVDDPQVRSG